MASSKNTKADVKALNLKTSRLSGFYKLERGARLDYLCDFSDLPVDQARILGQDGSLSFDLSDLFVENAVGSFPLPLGIATSFKMNGNDYVLPMAVEESSVIAAASNAARWVYQCGGFSAECKSNLMIGQVQLLDAPVERFEIIKEQLLAEKESLLQLANQVHPRLLMRGGGVRDLEVHLFPNAEIPFIVVHWLLDTSDAMGANLVNTLCEKMAPELERISGCRAGLRILSNLANRKLFTAKCRLDLKTLELNESGRTLSGEQVAKHIVEAFVFADNDPHRAATHNKGIMNGIDPVAIATGNDWRAIEAGAHAYASLSGRYRSLSRWSLEKNSLGEVTGLLGELTLPLQVGTVGGVTRLHPMAKVSLQILGNPRAKDLGCLMACAGLASNLAALKALCTTGIQRGHMKLHAKNLSLAAGARGSEVEWVSSRLVAESKVSASVAERILGELRRSQEAYSKEYGNSDSDMDTSL